MNLNQITISVRDVAKSMVFYEHLGLELIVKSLPTYARFQCPMGDATFSLHQSDQQINDSTFILKSTISMQKSMNFSV